MVERKPEPVAEPLRRRIDLGPADPVQPIYAIGDVHGRIDLLLEAERRIADDVRRNGTEGLIVMVGDYIDRGPDSAAVLEHLTQVTEVPLTRITLCGNHEVAFLHFLQNPTLNAEWLDFGGRQTLMSYGIDIDHILSRGKRRADALHDVLRASIPEKHVELLRSMPISLRTGKFFFVHAGVRPGVPLEAQSEHDMLWIREPFLSRGPEQEMIVIHGHTPSPEPTTGPRRIGIDTGAVSTNRLTTLKIAGTRARLI